MSLFLDATAAVQCPAEEAPGFERIVNGSGTVERYTSKLVRDRTYTIATAGAAVRVRWAPAATDLASATSFRIPANTSMTFRACEGQLFLSVIGDGAAYEAWVWPSGR